MKSSNNENKRKKRVPQTNGDTSQNHALQQISHQRNKPLSSPTFNILLKRSKGVSYTELNNKEVVDATQGFTLRRWHRLYVSRKVGRGFVGIQHYIDATIH